MDSTENPIPANEEFDDVEAHGLKEVAAGIGAAAILGGASAGAALAATSASSDHTIGKNVVHSVQQTEGSLTATVKHRTPQPPPDTTANSTRSPAQTPQASDVTKRVAPIRVQAPVGKGPGAAVDSAKKVTKNVTKTTEKAAGNAVDELTPNKTVPPIY